MGQRKHIVFLLPMNEDILDSVTIMKDGQKKKAHRLNRVSG